MTEQDNNDKAKNRLYYYCLAGAVVLAMVVAFLFVGRQSHVEPVQSEKSEQTVKIGGEFTLRSHENRTVTELSWPGKHRLIFFGFTHCPDVCPTELARMTKLLENLPNSVRSKIQPLFITVDPKRDDVETMALYLSNFHPDILGLTGGQQQIDQAIQSFRVYAQAQEPDEEGYYVVDHSAYLYFMTPDNELIEVFSTDESVDEIKSSIQTELKR